MVMGALPGVCSIGKSHFLVPNQTCWKTEKLKKAQVVNIFDILNQTITCPV